MSFSDLPPQTSINANADLYAEKCLERSKAAAEALPCVLDIPYGPDYWQKLDLYRPEGDQDDLPILLFFHGGNFTHGYKEWCGFMAPAITAFPAIFVSASYRLAPHTPYREIIEDGFSALSLLRRIAPEHVGDPERIFIGGHSAGAQMVAQMALRDDWRTAAGLDADAFRAVFPLSGSYSRRLGDLESDARFKVAPETPDSPIELAGKARHPFAIAWGGKERDQLRADGSAFAAALAQAGAEVISEEYPEADHFSIHLDMAAPDNPYTTRIRDWMTTRRF